MYCTPEQKVTARKAHRCTYCGQAIEVGAVYHRWASVERDEKMYPNKMHLECLDDAREYGTGDFEYHPFDNERPVASDQQKDI